ncbi:hypothetical protein [Mycobacterium mantenii]|uniref:hypothetical protein n=1 Tax=Mycobacterium mantenii TaxID=560555 RepID=UPI000AC74832|nr:hypothetical protein [Mycobacterium mantenii]
MIDPIRFHKTRHGVPFIVAPQRGQPLTVALAYANRARAERQASAWNALQPIDGLRVKVGCRDDNGQWPLVWTESAK